MKTRGHYGLGVFLVSLSSTLAFFGIFLISKPSDYQAVTRLKLMGEFTEAYIMETEFEVLRSEFLLEKAVAKLTASTSGNRPEQLPLFNTTALRERSELRAINDHGLFEIRASDRDPLEAAKVANTIADAYIEHRRLVYEDSQKATVEAITETKVQLERKIRNTVEEIDRLKRELHVPDPEPQNITTEYQTYAAAKQRLQEMTQFMEALRAKLNSVQSEIPTDQILVVHRAAPPEKPVSFTRAGGTALLALGSVIAMFGLMNLAAPKDQPTTSPPAPH